MQPLNYKNDYGKTLKQNRLLAQPFSLLKSVAFQILSLTFTIHQRHNFKSYKLQSWKVVKIFRDDAKSQRKTTTKFLEKLNYVPTANETDRTISLSKLNS